MHFWAFFAGLTFKIRQIIKIYGIKVFGIQFIGQNSQSFTESFRC